MKINALESLISSGGENFPIYIGFVKAHELLEYASVPNFSPETEHYDIATNVLTPPVKQWQRPLIAENKQRISKTFDDSGEFMPNPVLVAERAVGAPVDIKVTDFKVAGGCSTGLKEITLSKATGEEAPLWIIDGQHRITGLGDPSCAQRDNPIPVVLLLNNGGNSYNGRNLAKIFAQVTTEATPLASLHKEWLTFSFNLDKYSVGATHTKAMETVAILCKSPHFKTISNNPFHDDIRFNDSLNCRSKFLGQQYECKDLTYIIEKYYYAESNSEGHLEPIELAEQISIAFTNLKKIVRQPHDKSVFFGKANFFHKIMCDAFIVGVLAHLNEFGDLDKVEWGNLLSKLNFQHVDWNFQQYVIKSTRWVDKSKKLALAVFEDIFRKGKLPTGVNNIWDYLAGDQLKIELTFKELNADGRPINAGSYKEELTRGSKKSIAMGTRRHFRVSSKSMNAKHIEIFDDRGNAAHPIKYKPAGSFLKPEQVSNSNFEAFSITFKVTLYGGNEDSIKINLASWEEDES